jgi:type IV pilus assembly protein PilW
MVHPRTLIHRQRGLTLVELMVSLALGLVLIGAMLTLLARNSHNSMELERSSRQVENGRYALQRLSEDIHHAGYYGDYLGAPAPSGAAPDPCLTATAANMTALKAAMAWRIQASTALATAPACIDSNDFVVGSNLLVLRFAHPTVVIDHSWTTLPTGFPADGKTYFQANVDNVLLATSLTSGSNSPSHYTLRALRSTGNVSAPVFQYMTRIYFLSPCTRLKAGQAHCTSDADDGNPVPSLKMIELGSVAFSDPITVSEGIERLEYDYGIDTNGDGSADNWSRCAGVTCAAAQWADVVAVRVSVLARNAEASAGFTDGKTYSMGLFGDVTPASAVASYKRHAYQGLVRLYNVSMGREL